MVFFENPMRLIPCGLIDEWLTDLDAIFVAKENGIKDYAPDAERAKNAAIPGAVSLFIKPVCYVLQVFSFEILLKNQFRQLCGLRIDD